MTATEFRNLMERAGRRMFIAAVRVTASDADAEDAVQEAMVRLWNARRALTDAENPEAYAAAAARRCALDQVKMRRPAESLDEARTVVAEPDAADARDSLAVVVRIVDLLPSPQREVITLRDLQGLEMEEIQQQLNLTAANARVILSRARAAVRKYFSHYD